MKKIIAAVLFAVSFNAFANDLALPPGDTALIKVQEAQIQELEKKLAERDLTIQELQSANLDLLCENVTLKEANNKLRAVLANNRKELIAMKAKYNEVQLKAAAYKKQAEKKIEEVRGQLIRQFKAVKVKYN